MTPAGGYHDPGSGFGIHRWQSLVVWYVLYLAAHLLVAEWAHALTDDGSVLPWYPPAGLAVAALVLAGPRLLPAVVLGEILSTWLLSGVGSQFGTAGLVANGVVLATGWWVAAWVFGRLGGQPGLRSLRDIAALAVAALVAGPVVTAGLGVFVQLQAGLVDASEYLSEFATFWMGDVVGVSAVTPALLVAASAIASGTSGSLSDRYDRGRAPPIGLLAAEALVPALLAGVLVWVVDTPMRIVYLAVVPAVVLAIYHGVRMAAAASLALCGVLVAAASALELGTAERVDLQMLAVAVSLLSLTVGALESHRRDVLAGSEELVSIAQTSPDLIATATREGEVLYCNPAGRRMLGITDDEPLTVWEFVQGASRAQLREAVRAALADELWSGDNTMVSRSGQRIEVSQIVVGHRDPDGVVRRLSTHCHDITDHRRLQTQLANKALYDDLTGLANRALLIEQLQRSAGGGPMSPSLLCLVDLVRFRDINESLGYGVGDEVLATVAKRLSMAARPRQVVARLGADTFAILDDEVVDEYDALSLGTAVAETISQPIKLLGNELVIEVAVGAVFIAERQDALDTLRQAEIALSRGKESHRRFALFNSEMDRRARDRVLVESDLRRAIAYDEWALEYQPVVDLQTRTPVCCEALLRWTHPERGPMPAGAVVAMAESTGLIVPLGLKVLEEACRMACAWHAAGHDVSVAVNVSGRQLAEPDFTTQVAAVFASTGVVPEKVILEVTESALVSGVPGGKATLGRLRALGCQVAIDDFGTGYASFSSLRELAVDELKLDRSFLTDLTTSRRTLATVEALISMANAMGMVVVAEGVEEVEQLELLRAVGCHRAQGYLLARPMPPEKLGAFLGQPLGG